MKHITTTLIAMLALGSGFTSAADKKAEKKPKEMKPKLVEVGSTLLSDRFDTEAVDKKWISEAKADEVGLRIEDGALKVNGPSGGTRGLVETKFAAPVNDVHLQFLLKPNACESIAIGFRQKTAFGYAVYGALNRFAVVDRTKEKEGDPPYVSTFKPVTVVTDSKDAKAWRRICIECKGDKVLVRQDNKVLAELEHPFVGEEKSAFVIAGYGGAFLIDEVTIAMPASR
jgi:hypothetical protein